jgi:acyl dehydratase
MKPKKEKNMTTAKSVSRGFYFEEFEVGQEIVSVGRTVTESDVFGFAGLTGDYNQIHTDAEYSRTTPFGQRIAHGLLVLSIAMGLSVRTGFVEGTVLAFREITSWKFIKPVFIGDTVHVDLNVVALKAMPRIGGGSVTIDVNVRNQDDDVVMKGTWVALVLSHPE